MTDICVCTSYLHDAEPRAPRHALTLAHAYRDAQVVLVECGPVSKEESAAGHSDRAYRVLRHTFPDRAGAPVRAMIHKLGAAAARIRFVAGGELTTAAVGRKALGLTPLLEALSPRVIHAHNVETLLPAWRAAESCGATLLFDAMEYYADMGDGQTEVERKIAAAVQSSILPRCALITTASPELAGALRREYAETTPVESLYNVPDVHPELPDTRCGEFSLYWRNSVLDFGQRGLDEALVALASLPEAITLHLQGRLAQDQGKSLLDRIADLGVEGRVQLHEPYPPERAVLEAAGHTIGLCLERRGVKNHDLTVSNKIFDYHMAGLVTVCSDLPGLRRVVQESGGGVTFRAGDSTSLCSVIQELYEDRELVAALANKARRYALQSANRQIVMGRFVAAMQRILPGIPSKRRPEVGELG